MPVLTVSRALRMRIEDADRESELFVDDAYRFRKIRIVRHNDELIAVVAKRIDQHVGGDVDVGALLLDFHDLCRVRTTRRRIGESHARLALQKVAIVNGKVRNRFEGANENLLPSRHMWIGGRAFYRGREVSDPVDRKSGENCKAELSDVEPLVWSALSGSVIQVEAVDVNVRANAGLLE